MHKLQAAVVIAAALSLGGCTYLTGKSAGRNVDDATITSEVKAKLTKAHPTYMTRINVDTNEGTVYLNGTVPDKSAKDEAADIARDTDGVRKVVNNLQTQSAADQPRYDR